MKVTTFDLELREGQSEFPDFHKAEMLLRDLYCEPNPDIDMGQSKDCAFVAFREMDADTAHSEALIGSPCIPFMLKTIRLKVPQQLIDRDVAAWKKAHPVIQGIGGKYEWRECLIEFKADCLRNYLKKALPEPSTVECLWDTEANKVYVMSGSPGVIDEFVSVWKSGNYEDFPVLRPVDAASIGKPWAGGGYVQDLMCRPGLTAGYESFGLPLVGFGSDFILDMIRKTQETGSFVTADGTFTLGKSVAFVGSDKAGCSLKASELFLNSPEVLTALRQGKKPKWFTFNLDMDDSAYDGKFDHTMTLLNLKATTSAMPTFDYEVERLKYEIEEWGRVQKFLLDAFNAFMPGWLNGTVIARLLKWIENGWGNDAMESSDQTPDFDPEEGDPEDDDPVIPDQYATDSKEDCFDPNSI